MSGRMTLAEAEALVRAVVDGRHLTVAAYCRAAGLVYSTTVTRGFRGGFHLGTMVRREKLRRVMERPDGISINRYVLTTGLFSSPQSFSRTRRDQLGIDRDARAAR